MEENKTFEDKAVEFIVEHPTAWVSLCTAFGVVLNILCWKFSTKCMAKSVVKELMKSGKI